MACRGTALTSAGTARPLARRLLAWLLTVLAVHAACFLLVRGARGGPFDAERELPPEVEAALRAEYQLDEPLALQYLHALGGLLRGDFGPSLRYRGVSVNQVLADSLPLSLLLGAGGLAVALLLGLPAGLLAARRPRGAADGAVRVASSLALALPNFVLAGFLVLLFAFTLGWLPPAGFEGPRSLLLPWFSLGLPFAAQVARLVRTGALDALDSEAVRAARARGLGEGALLLRHVLPRALVPVVGVLGPVAAGMLTGSLVIEQVFALPGLGAHFVQAALNRDYTLALGLTVVYTALLGLLTLGADILMTRLDPRSEALS